jgi:putative heme iron utilization protein
VPGQRAVKALLEDMHEVGRKRMAQQFSDALADLVLGLPKKVAVRLLARKDDAVFGEQSYQNVVSNWLAVDDDTVTVEDDEIKRHRG